MLGLWHNTIDPWTLSLSMFKKAKEQETAFRRMQANVSPFCVFIHILQKLVYTVISSEALELHVF